MLWLPATARDELTCSPDAGEETKGGGAFDGERVGVSRRAATGVLMYRSGLASVINNIPQPCLAYVPPQRVSSITNSLRRLTNERLVAKSRFMREQTEIYLEEAAEGEKQSFPPRGALMSSGDGASHVAAMKRGPGLTRCDGNDQIPCRGRRNVQVVVVPRGARWCSG